MNKEATMNNQLYRDIWKYSDSGRADWLNEFAWQKIPIKPLKFGVEGVVTAMYCALTDTLKIADDRSDAVFFGSVIHELYHAYQRHTKGIMRYLFMKTFRRSEIEAPAKQAELDATEWLGDQRIKTWRSEHDRESN